MTGTPVRPDSRRVLAAVLVMAAFGGLGYVGWSVATAESPEGRAAAARNLAAGIDVSVGVDHSSLAATLAIADFGIEERVRLVPVRILEQIGLELPEVRLGHIESFGNGAWHLIFHFRADVKKAHAVPITGNVAAAEWFDLKNLPDPATVAHHGWAVDVLRALTK